MTKPEILDRIKELSDQLGGTLLHQEVYTTEGDRAKRIIITYDNEIPQLDV